jgi:hypothetical protein
MVWAITSKTGSPIPLDPERSPDGNVVRIGTTPTAMPLVLVLVPDDLAKAREHGVPSLYQSHFVTCPDANKWRRSPTQRRSSERSSS